MSDRILGGVCVAVAASMAWAAHDYAAPFSYEPVGPRAFPLLLALLMALCGLWLVVRPSLTQPTISGGELRLLALAGGAVIVYAVLFEVLGFALATTLMALPVGMAFGGSWKQSLAGGLGLGLIGYFFFDRLLEVTLPSGVLAPLLGGS